MPTSDKCSMASQSCIVASRSTASAGTSPFCVGSYDKQSKQATVYIKRFIAHRSSYIGSLPEISHAPIVASLKAFVPGQLPIPMAPKMEYMNLTLQSRMVWCTRLMTDLFQACQCNVKGAPGRQLCHKKTFCNEVILEDHTFCVKCETGVNSY